MSDLFDQLIQMIRRIWAPFDLILYSRQNLTGEVENSEFSENSETLENQFSEVFTPSFPFYTIPKTENSELKTSEFSLRQFDQTQSFSNSELSILHHTETENSEVTRTTIFLKLNDVT